jgi:hypothetical protein
MYFKGEGPTVRLEREAFGKKVVKNLTTDLVAGIRVKAIDPVKATKSGEDECQTLYYGAGKRATIFKSEHPNLFANKDGEEIQEGSVVNLYGLPLGFNGLRVAGFEIVSQPDAEEAAEQGRV